MRSGKSKAKAKANKGANVSPFSEVALAGKTLAEKIASVRGALIVDKCFFPQVFLFHIHLILLGNEIKKELNNLQSLQLDTRDHSDQLAGKSELTQYIDAMTDHFGRCDNCAKN